MKHLYFLPVGLALAFAGAAQAQVLTNLAISEHNTVTTVFGYNNGTDLSTFGTEYEQYNGAKATLNDGVTGIDGSNATTFGNSGGTTGTSYGFGGYENLVVPTGMEVTSVNLFQYAFGDGGWFGPNSDYSSNNPLKASDLSEPLLQATTDNGATWTNITATDNYLSQYTNIADRNSNLPEVTFTLPTALTNIDGIRVIGLNGGYAGSGGTNSTSGFMGITELQIEAQTIPEPSTYAMIFGGLSLLGFCVRRKATLL